MTGIGITRDRTCCEYRWGYIGALFFFRFTEQELTMGEEKKKPGDPISDLSYIPILFWGTAHTLFTLYGNFQRSVGRIDEGRGTRISQLRGCCVNTEKVPSTFSLDYKSSSKFGSNLPCVYAQSWIAPAYSESLIRSSQAFITAYVTRPHMFVKKS